MSTITWKWKRKLNPISDGTAIVIDLLIRPDTKLYIPDELYVMQFGIVLHPGTSKRLPLDLHEGDLILRAAWKATLIRDCNGDYVKADEYIDISIPDVEGLIIKPDDHLKMVYHRDIIAIFDNLDEMLGFIKHLNEEGDYGY